MKSLIIKVGHGTAPVDYEEEKSRILVNRLEDSNVYLDVDPTQIRNIGDNGKECLLYAGTLDFSACYFEPR